MTIR
jgi:mRNA-degrading endonuclease toxin of MazEF toxin-antitoxin module/antitoxin component of MazEF toxin-antitoxin module